MVTAVFVSGEAPTLTLMTDQHREIVKVLYQHMIEAHTEHFGSVPVAQRHYLWGLAQQLVERLGLQRELYAQAEDSDDSAMAVPVEQMWDYERRNKGVGPVRRWREIQMLRSKYLPTQKGFR